MRVYLLSMGCAKNTADSEHLKALLESCGHEVTDTPEGSDCAIINTCGFILDAVKENIDAIISLENLKEEGKISKLIIAGCLVNRYARELQYEFFGVADLFVKSEEWDKVIDFLGSPVKENCPPVSPVSKNFWSRYLKISEGCNTSCSYCAIPRIRGRLRSVPMSQILNEARIMCAAGAKELCLVGQDLTVYGQDFSDGTDLRTLIRELNASVPAGTWIRLLYLHPNRVDESLIDFLMTQDKVLHYLDIPIQHADSKVLSLMNRPCPKGHMRKIFTYIRELDPLFTLRTTIMAGFPGETAASFDRVINFVSDIEFDRIGTFVYSREKGTNAYDFTGRVSQKNAENRCNRLMTLQAKISQERSELFIGREIDVMIEDIDGEAGEAWGRTYRDAPEVDGMTRVTGNISGLKPGDIVRAKINDCSENDLFGEAIA